MKIIAEQRYIKKADGKMWLQWRYVEDVYMDASGSLNVAQSKLSDWEDVPVCLDDFQDANG